MSSFFALWTSILLVAGGPVKGLSILPAPDRTDVVIAVDGEVEYRHFTMEGPSRLVVDLFGARHELPRDDFMDLHRGGITAVRTSQYSDDVVRIVLELEETVSYEVASEPGGLRVSLAAGLGSFEPWSTAGLAASSDAGSVEGSDAGGSTGMPGARAQDDAPANVVEPAVQEVQEADRIRVTFIQTPIEEVLLTFAEFAGRSIVSGSEVQGSITATIDNQPWDRALEALLRANGLRATEEESGIIRVDNLETLAQQERYEPLITRAYKINYAPADEVAEALEGIAGQQGGAAGGAGGAAGGAQNRGTITVGQGTNTVIVTDVQSVHDRAEALIAELDQRTPQVTIQAKIIFVNRTALSDFGVTYDLKDSQGNQLNVITPGAQDSDGDGVIELPDEQVQIGTNVISLGGNSVAALGNADNRIPSPTLRLLSSLIVGRHTLLSFVEALESVNLSDVQAEPSLTVSDNQTALIQVGERTPLRVVDASAGGGVGGAGGGAGGAGGQQAAGLPQATVQIEETGIILEATPHVTAGNNILMDLRAERSAPQVAESDVGLIFTTQNANTRVMVEDGETVVIAGLTVAERSESRSGIPLLMDMPFIGRLFRVTRESTVQRDLIILVTPHIVRDN
jgi:type IV pilus assembly protein PilQ